MCPKHSNRPCPVYRHPAGSGGGGAIAPAPPDTPPPLPKGSACLLPNFFRSNSVHQEIQTVFFYQLLHALLSKVRCPDTAMIQRRQFMRTCATTKRFYLSYFNTCTSTLTNAIITSLCWASLQPSVHVSIILKNPHENPD